MSLFSIGDLIVFNYPWRYLDNLGPWEYNELYYGKTLGIVSEIKLYSTQKYFLIKPFKIQEYPYATTIKEKNSGNIII